MNDGYFRIELENREERMTRRGWERVREREEESGGGLKKHTSESK
jgi:hypothetical protein